MAEDQSKAQPTKTEKSSYYFFKSTPAELQKQYAPVPLKPGQKLDFTPRVQTLHESTLVKKEAERKRAEEALKRLEKAKPTDMSYTTVRKNAYDFRDKEHEKALPEPEKYDPGMKVVIHGLQKAARYNDSVAEVLGELKDGRYPVKIIEMKKQLNVKKANLKLYRPVVCTEFTDVTDEVGFRCTPELLFQALTNQDMVSKYTQSKATIDIKANGEFSLFEGSIHGSFLEVKAPGRIVKKWRFKEWPDDCFSTVTISITSPEYGVTVLTLKQTGVPMHDKYRNRDVPQKVKKGWKNFFWDRIHKVVGFAKVDKKEYSGKAKKEEEDDD
mmetsp:Transcript_9108/g.17735  ORF Transcript_9108/g.17735 Transcript_9108/m.17735 type:complete len:327 (-) Transcript_9108:228-1208(-)